MTPGHHGIDYPATLRVARVVERTGVLGPGVRAVDRLRTRRPRLSVMSYSGCRLEWLRSRGSAAQRGLLDRLDLLIDGPYVERWHAPLRCVPQEPAFDAALAEDGSGPAWQPAEKHRHVER